MLYYIIRLGFSETGIRAFVLVIKIVPDICPPRNFPIRIAEVDISWSDGVATLRRVVDDSIRFLSDIVKRRNPKIHRAIFNLSERI